MGDTVFYVLPHVYINMTDLKTTPSEENTLSSKGYKLLKFLGEGAYAKVSAINKSLHFIS